MPITIRRAQADDAPLLAKLNQRVQELHRATHPTRYRQLAVDDPALLAIYAQHLANPDAHIFIASLEDVPVGYLLALVQRRPGNIFVYGRREFHIDQMSVEADAEGQGVGQQLLAAALASARDLDIEVVSLGVAAFNERAIAFYEQQGFVVHHLRMSRKL